MWRWSQKTGFRQYWLFVFSTYVEVILDSSGWLNASISFLHVCGGDPVNQPMCKRLDRFSPRMWRWSWEFWNQRGHYFVFSTYVEVIPLLPSLPSALLSFLHVCGGDPALTARIFFSAPFSPRMWRWSWRTRYKNEWAGVFSTYVEVIPVKILTIWMIQSFLHVCGGDPELLRRFVP